MRALVRSMARARGYAGSDVQAFLVRTPGLHVEAAVVDRPAARRGPRILHEEHDPAGLGDRRLLEVGIGIVEHRAGAIGLAADAELAFDDVPDLGEVVLVARMMSAGLVAHQAGVRLGGAVGPWMEQHLAPLAVPAQRLP